MTAAERRTSAKLDTLGQLAASFPARGDRKALIAFDRDGVTELSYVALHEQSTAVAQGLKARGIGLGDRVALWAPSNADWIVGYFGIVGCGAAAVPLDHQATAEVAAAALAHAAPRAVLTTAAHCAEVEPHTSIAPQDFLLLDAEGPRDWRQLQATASPAELPAVAAADLASVLFTSGTTGTPKAVPLTHGNLTANVTELLAARLIGGDDRVLLPLPLHHTYPFTVGLLMALANGATVVLPAGISGPEISRAAATARATAMLAVPRLCTALWDSVQAAVQARGPVAAATFQALLRVSIIVRRLTGWHIGRGLFRAVHERLGPALRIIGCGGAKLPGEMAWNLEGLGWTVLTGYGLTETSPVLTFNSPAHCRIGSEGRALPGVELRIAAPTAQPEGEIEAQGPSVFSGYWHNEAATAEAFTPDGWFRTGDLGRLDEDGYLYVVGRNKELIVLPDGKKLFPESIEKLYAVTPLVRELGIFEHGGTLVALVVPDENTVRERGALREAALLREALEDIAARLPPYQRLGTYRMTRAPLPRTQLGKLKRHLLPALFEAAARSAPAANDAAPSAKDLELLEHGRSGEAWQWLRQRFAEQPLTLDTSPQLDLQIDSLEWVTLTIEIERRFGVVLTGEALSRILTLRDLLREIAAAPVAAASEARAALPAFEPPGPALRMLGAAVLSVLRLALKLGWRLETVGAEKLPEHGPLLIAPNHTSYLDPAALAAALPWRQLRRTYWAGWVGVMHSSPLRRLVSRATQVFPVDPDRDLAAALRTAEDLLRRGYSVVWFPEGRRSPSGELQRFQTGVGVLLERGAATAVPTAIQGTYSAWPKHQRWPRLRPLRVTFGDALSFPGANATAESISSALEQAARELLEQRPAPASHGDQHPSA